MAKWMDYYKIQEYKRKKFHKSQTARKLGINRETVGVYWDMTPEAVNGKYFFISLAIIFP
ncbi:MAG: hypothetical protein RSC17_09570 [Lachnospiraceae bacterium]